MDTIPDPVTTRRAPEGPESAWLRLVVVATIAAAVADLAAMALQRSVIPPVLVGALLSLALLPLVRRRPTGGLIALAVLSALLVATGAPFAAPGLGHPDSPIGFVHSVMHLAGRGVVVLAALGALRSRSPRLARTMATVAAAGAVVMVGIATVATVTRADPAMAAGDVRVDVRRFDFPDHVEAAAGAVLFVDNHDTVWHHLTIPGTDIEADLTAGTGARVTLDLAPGEYALFCDITGHDTMSGELVVTEG